MIHFEYRLNWSFWRSKKVVQVVQIGEGGREVIWTKSKRAAAFLREPLPYAKPYSSYLPPSAGGIGAQTNIANAEPCPSILIVPLPLPLFIYVSYILIISFWNRSTTPFVDWYAMQLHFKMLPKPN